MGSGTTSRTMRFAGNAARHRLRPGAAILLYHRVAEQHRNPWAIAVPPQRFAAQMALLKRFARPMPLSRFARLAECGALPPRAVAVTFDDGYVDNLTTALPILESHGVPATIFVVGMDVHGDREFWWDELERVVMGSANLPRVLTLTIAGETCCWNLEDKDDPLVRIQVTNGIRARLQRTRHAERRATLDALHRWAGTHPPEDPARRPMTAVELRRVSTSELIEIGTHTASHPSMTWLAPQDQADEILAGKASVEAALGRQVESFSYPFGEVGSPRETSEAILRKAGITIACTSERRTVRGLQQRLRLPRYSVGNWSTAEFAARLGAWLLE